MTATADRDTDLPAEFDVDETGDPELIPMDSLTAEHPGRWTFLILDGAAFMMQAIDAGSAVPRSSGGFLDQMGDYYRAVGQQMLLAKDKVLNSGLLKDNQTLRGLQDAFDRTRANFEGSKNFLYSEFENSPDDFFGPQIMMSKVGFESANAMIELAGAVMHPLKTTAGLMAVSGKLALGLGNTLKGKYGLDDMGAALDAAGAGLTEWGTGYSAQVDKAIGGDASARARLWGGAGVALSSFAMFFVGPGEAKIATSG